MASDLKIDIDGIRLNVRGGVIMRYGDEFVIEISTVGANSTIPGGRIKINEPSCDAIVRETQEEMGLTINKNNLKQIKVFENFFNYEKLRVHEMYFLYEYVLNDEEYNYIKNLGANKDNNTTYFTFINKFDLEKHNLLPLELHPIIKGEN